MPGPAPQPTELKRLRGNRGHHPINEAEPKFDAILCPPPEWLDENGAAMWRRVAPKLSAQRVLTEVDVELFAAGCDQWSVYRRAVASIRAYEAAAALPGAMAGETGLVGRSPANGMAARPEVAVARAALKEFRAIMAEFGIGAASRSKVALPPGPGEATDPGEAFLREQGL